MSTERFDTAVPVHVPQPGQGRRRSPSAQSFAAPPSYVVVSDGGSPVLRGHMAGVRLRQQARHVAASGRHGSLGSGLAGHSSSRAPRTAAWSENRSSGLAML